MERLPKVTGGRFTYLYPRICFREAAMSVVDRALRVGEGRALRHLLELTREVGRLADDMQARSDAELAGLTTSYRHRHAAGESLEDLLPEAFATAREAARRVLGQRPYDVQVMGGAALHLGNIAEMRTGEGKTLASVLPVYLNALAGRGVHVVTVNDYLARRDAEWMGQVHRFLNLSVGVVVAVRPGASPATEHRDAYGADVTYGTNNEFGFDYLRDNLAKRKQDLVQRDHFFAVVDEVDSILIDEARTPLILSGPADGSIERYSEFATVVAGLREGVDYELELAQRVVAITERGVATVEQRLGIDNLYESWHTAMISHLTNALKAKELYQRDRDYIVVNGEVLIVDEFTGRVLYGRRYNEGLHQAIEAKENVVIRPENQTVATITLQNYFRLYQKLAGMTGTAATEATEFHKVYRMGVVAIPTHRRMVRVDEPDVVYKTVAAKFDAVVEDIVERHRSGQPVLVGTISVENSEQLSERLHRRGIPHTVLNAKYHDQEADIIAQAGRHGAVTVATNMAGRGTDILLGGNPEILAQAHLRGLGLDSTRDPAEYELTYAEQLRRYRRRCAEEADQVIEAGGLYVLGTERHESRRIDNQLRGRSGRQGDPGTSRFYLSLHDDLMRRFRGVSVEAVMNRLNIPDDVPIESKVVSRRIRAAQAQIEALNAEQRQDVLKYDEVMNKQRQVVYTDRRRILDAEDMHAHAITIIGEVIAAYVAAATVDSEPSEWDLATLWTGLRQLYPIGLSVDDVVAGQPDLLTRESLRERLTIDASRVYRQVEAGLGPQVLREAERRILLEAIDNGWRDHLYEMDYLQAGIGLRGYGQRDPLVEYQREGFAMFEQMRDGVREKAVTELFAQYALVEPKSAGGSGFGSEFRLPVRSHQQSPGSDLAQVIEKPGRQFRQPGSDLDPPAYHSIVDARTA